jgi:hypothetical protein
MKGNFASSPWDTHVSPSKVCTFYRVIFSYAEGKGAGVQYEMGRSSNPVQNSVRLSERYPITVPSHFGFSPDSDALLKTPLFPFKKPSTAESC